MHLPFSPHLQLPCPVPHSPTGLYVTSPHPPSPPPCYQLSSPVPIALQLCALYLSTPLPLPPPRSFVIERKMGADPSQLPTSTGAGVERRKETLGVVAAYRFGGWPTDRDVR